VFVASENGYTLHEASLDCQQSGRKKKSIDVLIKTSKIQKMDRILKDGDSFWLAINNGRYNFILFKIRDNLPDYQYLDTKHERVADIYNLYNFIEDIKGGGIINTIIGFHDQPHYVVTLNSDNAYKIVRFAEAMFEYKEDGIGLMPKIDDFMERYADKS
jgi:hypothetical protein